MTQFASVSVIAFLLATAHGVAAADPVSIGPGQQPRIAASPDGAVYVVFGAGDEILCARSDDSGATFSRPVKVATLPGLMLGKRRGPRLAVTKDAVVVTAISRKDGSLVSWRSTDRGRSWTGTARVNDFDKACREGLHDTAAGPNGEVASLWLDLRNEKTELWMSTSTDGGATWGKNVRIYRSPGGSICECCHPSLIGGAGGWRFLWRNSVGGDRDIYVMADGAGETAVKLGATNWKLEACPMDGGDLAAGGSGSWAVWRREWECYATSLDEPAGERLLGDGEQPVVAVVGGGPVFAWIAKRPGDLLVLSPNKKTPVRIARDAADPDLLVTPSGDPLIAWERVEGGTSSVFVARIAAD